jgi:cytochrome b561
MSDSMRYDQRSILLHWLTAGLVVLMWGLAQIIDFFPKPLPVYPRSAHILLGLALVCVALVRVIWRRTGGRKLPPADTGLQGKAATAVHYGLYLLLAGTLALGLGLEAVRADNILNLFQLPSIAPGDRALRDLIGDWHGTAANALLILAGLHAAAALFHHYVVKDGVLRRMLPG